MSALLSATSGGIMLHEWLGFSSCGSRYVAAEAVTAATALAAPAPSDALALAAGTPPLLSAGDGMHQA